MFDLLKGIRVLDLTAVVLGPFATQYLGDLGADVIKVEPPSGDIFRYVRPARSDGMGAGFLNMNRNKRSITLDLKSKADQLTFQTLLEEADVLVHNMRPSAAKRLGLDPVEICKRYPLLVYCSSAGFSSTSSFAERPAYDDIIQAAAGVAALNSNDKGEPRFLPTIICDKVGGMHLAMAVLGGLVQQQKTGKGCHIDAPMFDGMIYFLMAEQLAGETFDPAVGSLGYERLTSPYRKPFATKDGFIGVLPYTKQHWVHFLNFIGREDLATASWVLSAPDRSERIGELYALIEKVVPARTSGEWLQILDELDIPCAPVKSLTELLNDEYLKEIDLFQEVDHPTEGAIRSTRSPFTISGSTQSQDLPAPGLSAETVPVAWRSRGEDHRPKVP